MTPTPEAADRLRRAGLIALAVATVYQLVVAFQSQAFLVQNVFVMDDAFYYFQVARNHRIHGFATFDGIHQSSGIQILWGIVLGGVARVFHGRLELLRAIMVLCISLNVVAGLLFRRVGRAIFSSTVGEVACLIWAGFMLALTPTMIGMEYTLHICVILPTVLLLWRLHRRPEEAPVSRLLLLAGLLTLNFWVRLDSAIYTLVLCTGAVLVIWRRRRRIPVREGFALLAPPALGLALFVVVCLYMAGTPTPLSGMVKRHYSFEHFDAYPWYVAFAGHGSWWVRILVRPMVDIVCSALTERLPFTQPAVIATCGAVAVVTWIAGRSIVRRREEDAPTFEAFRFVSGLWVLGALHAALVVAVIGHFSHVTQHYYGWNWVLWCLWGGVLVSRGLGGLKTDGARRVAVVAAAGGLLVAYGFVVKRDFTPNPMHLHVRRLAAMDWIEENLPEDTLLGAWNAGEFGYFCERTFVNLDGLANDHEFLEHLRSDGDTLEYLRREGIGYVVDLNEPDLTMPYRAGWDVDTDFRMLIPMDALEVAWTDDIGPRSILVLRVKRP